MQGCRRDGGGRTEDETVIELELGIPGPAARQSLYADHHRLPLFSTESQAFYANFLCHEADVCAVSVSTTTPGRRAKEATR